MSGGEDRGSVCFNLATSLFGITRTTTAVSIYSGSGNLISIRIRSRTDQAASLVSYAAHRRVRMCDNAHRRRSTILGGFKIGSLKYGGIKPRHKLQAAQLAHPQGASRRNHHSGNCVKLFDINVGAVAGQKFHFRNSIPDQ